MVSYWISPQFGIPYKTDFLLPAPATTMAAATVSALSSSAVFTAPLMTGIPHVTSPVSRLVRMEVIERLLSTLGNRSPITVIRIIAIVNVAVKAVTAMKPRASSDE